ncbi:glycosyltransferase [Providencia huaxiensis]|uniref:Glycosyltransferase n=1 Tax=Providencia rettgeri TaxID=587 RepID=A0AAD2VUN0_PRORE|nr:glycosyltransferase [Providencia rettgeri]
MKLLSIIYSYYNQPKMLIKVINVINMYCDDIKEKIELIIVDDGSKESPLIKKNIDCDSTFIKISEDVGFNNGGAKNLGIKYATGKWCLILDLDHWFDHNEMRKVIKFCEGQYNRSLLEYIKTVKGIDNYWYLISRVTSSGKNLNPNPNVKLVIRSFLSQCMYDEDFSGYYGYEDVLQMIMLNNLLGKHRILPKIKVYLDQDEDDSNTISITQRDTTRNKQLLKDKISGVAPYSKNHFRTKYIIL